MNWSELENYHQFCARIFSLNFINGNWRIFNEQLDRGEITLEQCMREQFSVIKTPKSVILNELELDAPFRPGFEGLSPLL